MYIMTDPKINGEYGAESLEISCDSRFIKFTTRFGGRKTAYSKSFLRTDMVVFIEIMSMIDALNYDFDDFPWRKEKFESKASTLKSPDWPSKFYRKRLPGQRFMSVEIIDHLPSKDLRSVSIGLTPLRQTRSTTSVFQIRMVLDAQNKITKGRIAIWIKKGSVDIVYDIHFFQNTLKEALSQQ